MGMVDKFFVLATRYEEDPVGMPSFSKELLSTILLDAY